MSGSETVPVNSDWEYEYDATRKATTTGNKEAAHGLSSVTAFFCLSEGGAAISGTTVTLVERSAKDGRYYGICDAAAMTTALTAYIGQRIYECFTVAGDRVTHEPVIVTKSSEPA